jgi:hypothetical protein
MSNAQPEPSPALSRHQSGENLPQLVEALATATGIRISPDEGLRVAAIFQEYLAYVAILDAAELDRDPSGPLGFDLLRWLAGHD